MLSDVHGNAVALEAVLEAVLAELPEHGPELVVLGGDLTWGPLPEETLVLFDQLEIPALFVRGNAERALLEPADDPTERERWLLGRHSPEALAFSAALPSGRPSASTGSVLCCSATVPLAAMRSS